MTAADQQLPVLHDIVSLHAGESLRRLRARGEPETLLLAAADEVEKLIIADLKRGMEAAESLMAVAELSRLAAPRARARRALAQGLAYSNRFEDALVLLREAIALAEGAGNTVEAARSRMTSLHALTRLGRYPDASQAGESARLAFVAAGEALLAARADANLGVVRRMADDPARALEHFDRARAVLHDQPVALAQLDSNRAEALLDLHRFADAEDAFISARAAFQRAGATRAAAIVEGNLADLASRRGRLDAALEHFERARRALGLTDAPADAARLQAEQAETLASLGLVAEAAEQFRAAVPVLTAHKLAWENARASTGLGAALARLQRSSEARPALADAAAAFEALNHTTGAARVRLLQAELARRDGEFAAAESLATSAALTLRERPGLGAMARLQLAWIHLSSGRTPDALAQIEDGLTEARSLGLAALTADLLQLRAQARHDAADHQGSVADLREAVEQIDRVRGTLRAERFRAAFLGGHAQVFERCLTAILDHNGPEAPDDAFEIGERARARALLDVLHGTNDAPAPGTDGDEHELLARASSLRAEMNALYAALDDGLSRPRTPTDHRRWADNVAAKERETIDLERRLAATARYAPVFSRPRSLRECRAALRTGEAMVCYFAEGDDLSAFVLRHDHATVRRRIARLDAVTVAVRAFEFQVARAIARGMPDGATGQRLAADATHELATLFTLLVRPIENDLAGADRLLVVPHGILHAVPFAALQSDAGPLIRRFEIVMSPSASVWSHLNARPAAAPERPTVVVGVSDELAPHAQTEAASLAAQPNASSLIGPGATVAAFRQIVPEAGVIHVASHARFSPADPLNSGLKLSDGWLTAREISTLRLAGPTVILSGCDTGRSSVGGGDEAWGLVRAFLVAGASTLIISLWPANDRIAYETMALFHADWYAQQGGGRSGSAASLRRAQIDLHGRGLHPAAWANFVLIGKP